MAKFIVLTLVAAFAVVAHGIGIPPAVTTPPNVNIFSICETAAAAPTPGLPTITQLPGVTTAGLPNTCKTAEQLGLLECTQIPPVLSGATVSTSAVLGYTCDLSKAGDKVYDAAGKEVSNPSVVIDQNGNAVVKSGDNQINSAVIYDEAGKAVGFTDSTTGKYYSLANATYDSTTGVITDKTSGATMKIDTTKYTVQTDANGNIVITPK